MMTTPEMLTLFVKLRHQKLVAEANEVRLVRLAKKQARARARRGGSMGRGRTDAARLVTNRPVEC
jgi:hypothetical protein